MKENHKKLERNYAFIDGQNLHLQTDFKIDFKRWRVYLKDKYNIIDAYYFLGFRSDVESLYTRLQKAEFILVFNERNENLKSDKSGNVDTNLVFSVMRSLIEDDFGKVLIVSGDGDYKQMIDYLIEKDRFKAILVPSKNVSSLYKMLKVKFVDRINNIKSKIEYKHKRKNSHRD